MTAEPSSVDASPSTHVNVEPYVGEKHLVAVADIWTQALPGYYVRSEHLQQLLDRKDACHFVLDVEGKFVGFCIAYVLSNSGNISVIAIEPALQGKGYGTILQRHVRTHLEARDGVTKILIGGHFPRFWPGVPTDLPLKDQDFFKRQGFLEGERAKDLYLSLASFAPPEYITERAKSSGIKFAPLHNAGFEECLTAQKANFSEYGGWVAAYERLHQQGLDHEVMVATDSSGRQVGWTLMLSPGSSQVWHDFAFLPIASGADGASDGKTGLIGCVGVDQSARKGGVGLAMLCAAMEEMKKRDIEGVFVDWVALPNWYEKIGFETWRDYRSFESSANGS